MSFNRLYKNCPCQFQIGDVQLPFQSWAPQKMYGIIVGLGFGCATGLNVFYASGNIIKHTLSFIAGFWLLGVRKTSESSNQQTSHGYGSPIKAGTSG